MFGKVHHTGYLTDDLARAVEFYVQALGGEVVGEGPGPAGGKVAFVRLGESEVELIEPVDKSRLGGRSGLVLDHVGYFVADLDQEIETLKAKGVAFGRGPVTNVVGDRLIYAEADSVLGTRFHLTQAR